MNTVMVAGVARDVDGQKESQVAFRKHFAEMGDALNNIAEGLDKDDPRPPYDPEEHEFPMMIYRNDRGPGEKGQMIVNSHQEFKDAIKVGWRKQPYPAVQIAVEDPKLEKLKLQQQLNEKDGQISSLMERLEQLSQRIDAVAADKKDS